MRPGRVLRREMRQVVVWPEKKEEISETGILEFFVNRSRRVVWLLKLPHCLLINTVLELGNQDYIEEC